MNSAPRDGTWILVGQWVTDTKGDIIYFCEARPIDSEQWWYQFVVVLDPNDERIPHFDAWTVIPKPPDWGKK